MFQAREYMALLRQQILGKGQSPSEESQPKRKKGMSLSSLGKEGELEDAKDSGIDEKEQGECAEDNGMEISTVVTGETAPTNESGKRIVVRRIALNFRN